MNILINRMTHKRGVNGMTLCGIVATGTPSSWLLDCPKCMELCRRNPRSIGVGEKHVDSQPYPPTTLGLPDLTPGMVINLAYKSARLQEGEVEGIGTVLSVHQHYVRVKVGNYPTSVTRGDLLSGYAMVTEP